MPSDRVAIQELLDRRAAAASTGDRKAFLGTLGPGRSSFLRRQRRSFVRLATVGPASYSLTADWSALGDLARPSDVARYAGAEAVAIPVTHERYRVAGFDRRDAVEDHYLTFVKRNGAWAIESDTDLEDLGLYSARHMWDFGPLRSVRTRRFLVWHHPCRRPGAGERCGVIGAVVPLLSEALARADSYWPLPWRRKVVVAIPDGERELERILQVTFDLDDFVAFAYATVDPDRGYAYVGPRIVLNWRALSGRPRSGLVSILAHELLHVATRAASGPFVPNFVEEGLADYAGHAADPEALAFFDETVAFGGFSGRLPANFEFITGTGTDIFLSYQAAQSAVRFFIQEWGLERFARFYRLLGRARIAAGTARFHLDRALRRTIGLGAAAFEREWAGSLGAS